MATQKILSIDELVKRGELFDSDTAAQILGYSEQHLRRLCRATPPRIGFVKRARAYYFTPSHLAAYFSGVLVTPVRAAARKRK